MNGFPKNGTKVTINDELVGRLRLVKNVDIQLTDGTNPVDPDRVLLVGDVLTIEVPESATIPVGARPPKSGATTSYADYDAGFYERGREVSFYKTVQNNIFGHNWAHTGTTGGYYDQDTSQYKDADGTVSDLATAFPDNIMIDWKTCDSVGVLMWRITNNGSNINWLDSVNGCQALTIGTFAVWALPETVEIDTLRNWELTSQLNWLPLAQTPALWTANSNIANTLTAYHRNGSIYTAATKTSSTNLRYIPCRWTLLTEL